MCHCTPSLRTPCCGRSDCHPKTATQINVEEHHLRNLSYRRSQELLRERGRELSLEELLAEIYKQGFNDAKAQ